MSAALDTLLRQMLEKGGSDLHLTVGLPPKIRASGSLVPLNDTVIDAKTMESLLKGICPAKRWTDFLEKKDQENLYFSPLYVSVASPLIFATYQQTQNH